MDKTPMTNKQLWTRWTLANAFSEMLGLGLTFAITGLYFSRAGEGTTVLAILISFVVAVASGAVEATFVGLAQWWAMRPRFPIHWPVRMVAGNVHRRAGRLCAGIPAFDHHEHGRGLRLQRTRDRTPAMGGSPAHGGDGCGRRRGPVVRPVACPAQKSSSGRNLDPRQHAGLDVRHACHLLGHRHGIPDVHLVAVWPVDGGNLVCRRGNRGRHSWSLFNSTQG